MQIQSPGTSTITILAMILLIAWSFYRRAKRMVSRQHLTTARPWITITVFPIIVVLFAYSAWFQFEAESLLFAGLGAGVGLGIFGLARTRFEPTPEGLYYTPNAHLGIALSLLMVVRIAWRFVQMSAVGMQGPQTTGPPDMSAFARSPLTLAIFGLLAGYYVAYVIGLVRWRSQVLAAT